MILGFRVIVSTASLCLATLRFLFLKLAIYGKNDTNLPNDNSIALLLVNNGLMNLSIENLNSMIIDLWTGPFIKSKMATGAITLSNTGHPWVLWSLTLLVGGWTNHCHQVETLTHSFLAIQVAIIMGKQFWDPWILWRSHGKHPNTCRVPRVWCHMYWTRGRTPPRYVAHLRSMDLRV